MNILSDEQRDLLAFVAACNRNSYMPTEDEVMLWWENPVPMNAEYRTVTSQPLLGSYLGTDSFGIGSSLNNGSLSKMWSTMFADQSGFGSNLVRGLMEPHTRRELVKPAETTLAHLVRLTWLAEDTSAGDPPGLYLTNLGRALLRNFEENTAPIDEVSVVVFEVEDPLAYPQLMGQLVNAGEGLLVDPYLNLEDVHRIVIGTRLTRLLISANPSNQRAITEIQTYLDKVNLGRQIEVRSSKELHDRVLIAEDRSVLTLGSSLNGVGRKLTVLSPIPPTQCAVFGNAYERIWEEAALVGPITKDAEEEKQDDDIANTTLPTQASDES